MVAICMVLVGAARALSAAEAKQGQRHVRHSQDIEHNIQMRAYLLWKLEDEQEGRADHYWHRARALIEAESHSAYPPTQSMGNRS
jgi:hypothetical protein